MYKILISTFATRPESCALDTVVVEFENKQDAIAVAERIKREPSILDGWAQQHVRLLFEN